MSLIVERAGFFSSVQDLGRVGFREFGVSTSGALDSFALRVANLLVGNEDGAAGLEITFGGLQLRFQDERIVAWCGGQFDVQIGSWPLLAGRVARLQAGGVDMPQAMKQLFSPLDTLVPGLPPAFVQVVARAVAYNVADRFPDAIALGVALGEALVMSTARTVAEMRP